MHSRLPITIAAAASALVTLAAALVPHDASAYRSPGLQTAIETATLVVAAVTSYLVFARFRDSAYVSDLLVALSLALLGSSGLAVVTGGEGDGAQAAAPLWLALGMQVVAAALLATAAVVPARRLGAPQRQARLLGAALAALLLAGCALLDVFANALPPAPIPAGASAYVAVPLLSGASLFGAAQLAQVPLLLVAALGCVRRGESTDDELWGWLAAGTSILAFSKIDYFLFPSGFLAWVGAGDVLRAAAYLVLLMAAVRELRAYWRRAAAKAVGEERRRIARDLHDGLAQELAFVTMKATTLLETGPDPGALRSLATAAERALGESRHAVTTLARPAELRLADTVADVAAELGGRAGLAVELDVADVDGPASVRAALVRILREAITNVARHASATTVWVELSDGDGTCLRVSDDGVGFDPLAPRRDPDSFGLIGMTERAVLLGGTLRIDSAPARGTTIEVRVP